MNCLIKIDTKQYSDVFQANNDQENINWWNESDDKAITCTESFLAIDLEKQLTKANCKVVINENISDLDLIIEIGSICSEKNNQLNGEEGAVEIENVDNTWYVSLYGNRREGTINAVYHFLNILNFKYYNTDDFGNIYPSELILNEGTFIYSPDYVTRGCYSEFMDDTHKGFIDWMTRNHMNFLRVKHYTNNYELKKRGISILAGGHEVFYNYLNPNKTDYSNSNNKTYFENHPNWFPLIDGKRSDRDENLRATEGYYTGNNICSSNSDGVHELCQNIIKSLIDGDYKFCDYLNFWAYDNGTWCQCSDCEKTGNYATRMLLLAYQLDKEIKVAKLEGKIKRNIRLLVPVYHETLEPPVIDLPEDFDYQNIIATFFPIERCYAHFINDENCTETNSQLKKLYDKWAITPNRKYKGEIFIGEYFNVSSFAAMPFLFPTIINHDLPFYYENNTRYFYYMHITSLEWGMLTVNNYLIAKILSDTKVNTSLVLSNYYKDVFPVSQKLINDFHNKLEELSKNSKYLKHYQFEKEGKSKKSLMWEVFEGELFPLAHCKFNEQSDDLNASYSMTKTMELFDEAREILKVIVDSCDVSEKEAVILEKQRFDYGYSIFYFLFNLVQLRLAHINNDKKEVKSKLLITEKLKSELLLIRRPLEDAKYECLNWLDNAYTATWVAGRYEDYVKKVKKFLSD